MLNLEMTPREKILMARALCNFAALLEKGADTGQTAQDRETARDMLGSVIALQNKIDQAYG